MFGFGEGDVVPEAKKTLADRTEGVCASSQRLGDAIARDLEADDPSNASSPNSDFSQSHVPTWPSPTT